MEWICVGRVFGVWFTTGQRADPDSHSLSLQRFSSEPRKNNTSETRKTSRGKTLAIRWFDVSPASPGGAPTALPLPRTFLARGKQDRFSCSSNPRVSRSMWQDPSGSRIASDPAFLSRMHQGSVCFQMKTVSDSIAVFLSLRFVCLIGNRRASSASIAARNRDVPAMGRCKEVIATCR